jgi:hypothetical protein
MSDKETRRHHNPDNKTASRRNVLYDKPQQPETPGSALTAVLSRIARWTFHGIVE